MLRTDHAHNTAGLLSSPVAEAARGGAGSRATSGGHRSRLATSADEQEIGGTEKRLPIAIGLRSNLLHRQ